MQASIQRILREETREGRELTPNDKQVQITILAFAGMKVGQIRTEANTEIEQIGNAIRVVRDAMRRGKAPHEILEQYPELVADQLAFQKHSATGYKPSPGLVAKLNSASRGIEKPHFGIFKFAEMVKERFAHIIVPMTMRRIAEGVERGDPKIIEMATKAFHIVPGPKGMAVGVAVNFPGGGSPPPEGPLEPQKEGVYFEQILRRARAKIDAPKALQAGDMPESMAEESDDAEI